MPAKPYDAKNTYPETLEEAQAAIGKTASVTMTGTIVAAGASDAGAWVRFELDERWGFPPGNAFVMDLAAFTVKP